MAIVAVLVAYLRLVYSVMVIVIGQDAILLSSMTLVVRSVRLQSGHLNGRILSRMFAMILQLILQKLIVYINFNFIYKGT